MTRRTKPEAPITSAELISLISIGVPAGWLLAVAGMIIYSLIVPA